ncbi:MULTISPECIES: A24 family peptidase [Pseudomonas]|uniref:Flp pilus assembly protein, protease CpaA n=1 Tax=Pseudomonas asplenii TaxID=53407 RepID=A0A0N0E5P9_9PSED|nr:A24 family peptidase [Pseudomonas fuscovaginae]KPA92649.1 Flp pilus assembly protein, protease CpaA [Pseudomonas fuscovaginae]KPA95445.1 Flp pilus assembly protein, protease CpaA [Pseudomonas fuscovaginae]
MHSLILLLWFTLCAAQDLRQREIANSLTLGGSALALFYLLWSGTTWLGASAEQGGWAFLLALLLTLPGYVTARLGAGDVKLLIALALASDSRYLLGTVIGAGVASLLWLWLGPRLWPLLGKPLKRMLHNLEPGTSDKQPFAPFLWVGLLCMTTSLH